jgi:hypothetical protein
MKIPDVCFDHLVTLSTSEGLFEHARFNLPRRDHGYCLDDVARALVVTTREPDPTDEVIGWSRVYLQFTLEAQDATGAAHNRRQEAGPWVDEPSTKDHWGRSLWGLGTTVAMSPDPLMRTEALEAAERAMRVRSQYPRSMAYAALGAANLLSAVPGHGPSLALLADARVTIGRSAPNPQWPWPEPRLAYANAVIPEALIAIGHSLGDEECVTSALGLLTWLVAQQTRGTHLSVVPVGGWSTGESRPSFDQQPIEVTALAEAAWRAMQVDDSHMWPFLLDRCLAWFLGWNDIGQALYDPSTGGAYDGLLKTGVNLNEGAESTLAALATFQLARLAAAKRVE